MPRQPLHKWTDEDDELVRKWYSEGRLIRTLADMKGWTRHMILGRAFRLGLSKEARYYQFSERHKQDISEGMKYATTRRNQKRNI